VVYCLGIGVPNRAFGSGRAIAWRAAQRKRLAPRIQILMEFHPLQQPMARSPEALAAATQLARRLLTLMRKPEIQMQIAEVHQFGARSQKVQTAILPAVSSLAWISTRRNWINTGVVFDTLLAMSMSH